MRKLLCVAAIVLASVAPVHAERPVAQVLAARHYDSLAIASWNLEWLSDSALLNAADYWNRCRDRGWPNERLSADLPFCDVYQRVGIVSASDYAARKLVPLRRGLAALAARGLDILAVQEVQGPSALAAVLPAGFRTLCFTTRHDAQNIGYAIRVASDIAASCREIVPLSLENDPGIPRPVRRGLELRLTINGVSLSMLNVHLKSGCSRGRMDSTANDACMFLQHQVQPLESWVESRAATGGAFAIVGDWNRDLEKEIRGHYPARSDGSNPAGPIVPAKVRNLFPEINDGAPAASAMSLAKVDRSAASTSGCFAVLDQLVISDRFKAMLDPRSLDGGQVAARLIAGPPGASDHCALETVLRMKP